MGLRDLAFNILARDRTGQAFDSVSRKLKGVSQSAGAAQARMRDFGTRATEVGGAMSLAMAPVALAFANSLTAFDDAERAAAKVEQAVKTTGGAAGYTAGELQDMAKGLQDVTRFDGDDVLNKVTAQLLTFSNVQGDVFAKAQVAALDLSTVLESDLQSSAIMLGKALNDPVKGLNAMSRAGVSFSEEQKNTIKALAETGDIAAAQGIILDELARQYGGQAQKAAQAGIGPMIQLRNAWGDLQEDVGRVMAAILPPIVSAVQGAVNAFLTLPEPVRNVAVVLTGLAAVAGPLIGVIGLLAIGIGSISAPVALVVAGLTAFAFAVAALLPQITALASFIADSFVAAWEGLKAAFDLAMNSPLEFAQKLGELLLSFNPIVLGVRAIGEVFDWLFPATMESLKKLVAGVKEWLLDRLSAIFDAVKNKIKAVGDAFFELWDRVVGHSYIPDLVDDIGVEMGRLDGEMVDPAIEANEKVGDSFRDMAKGAIGDLLNLAREGDLTLSSFFDTILGAGMRWADSLISNVFDRIAESASQSLFSGGGLFSGLGRLLGGGGRGDPLSAALAAIPGLDTGGDAAVVGGRGGMDRNLVRLRLSEGEKVQVTRRGSSGGGGGNVTVNISTPNPAAFQGSRAQVAATVTRAVALGQRGA